MGDNKGLGKLYAQTSTTTLPYRNKGGKTGLHTYSTRCRVMLGYVRMMNGVNQLKKFEVGDKVKLNKRTPKVLLKEFGLRYWRTRTIVEVVVCPKWHYASYRIGYNNRGWGPALIWFRSYMLDEASRGKPGTC